MSLLRDLVAELFGMFVADAGLSLATVSMVAATGGLIAADAIGPLAGGGLLLASALGILAASIHRAARRARH